MKTGVKAGSVVTTVEDIVLLAMNVIVRARAGVARRRKFEGMRGLLNMAVV